MPFPTRFLGRGVSLNLPGLSLYWVRAHLPLDTVKILSTEQGSGF